jgi:condensation domain-containing protein
MADRILVPFQGDGGGVGELSWGQLELWGAMCSKHTWMPMGTVRSLPAGTTLDDLVGGLRFLMRHYPTLRTRLRLDPDGTKQVVAESGEVALEVVDAGAADPAEVAEQVRLRYWHAEHDFAGDWPVRMAVIRHRGVLTHRVWVNCHLVTDAIGATIMVSELARRDASGSAAAMTPLAQARWQRSPAGQRQNELSLRHWEGLLRTIAARRLPVPAQRIAPRYWNGTFTSRALPLAAEAIAARAGVETSAVFLALFAMALNRVTGVHPVVTRVTVSNRFRPGLATTVSPIVHNGLCVLDVTGGSIDDAVRQARQRAMVAYKRAYYDPRRLDELVDRVRHERGDEVDVGCFFNDRRQVTAGPVPTAAQVRSARPASTFRWDDKQDDERFDPLFVSVEDAPDGVAMLVCIDTHHITPADAEACLRGMEDVAVAGAGS